MQTNIDESKIKQLLKEALIETLEERKGVFHDLIVEAMEDIALSRAIREGEKSGNASKNEIFDILEGSS
jgi:hypothetical protein